MKTMKNIVLINTVSHKVGGESYYEYLMGIDSYGSIRLSNNVARAKIFASEEDVKNLGLGRSYIMAEYDGYHLKVLGYPI